MNRRFLPGIAGADVPLRQSILPPTLASAGNGPLAGQTLNFDLNLVNFDWVTWHTYEWENWTQIDSLLNVAIGFLNLRGVWRANTDYVTGDTVFDPTDVNSYWRCDVSHTSSTDFEADKPLYWSERQDITPDVTSVFGRIGNVVALEADYAAFYPTIAQMLERVRWLGTWSAGTYEANDMVQDGTDLFIANKQTTERPQNGTNPPSPVDWDLLIAGGASTITSGDTFPTQPLPNDMHYMTAAPVGLYVYYDDGDSIQWVQTNGGGAAVQQPTAYHDPSNDASWRIDPVTNTLECWGTDVTTASGTVRISFAKTFARAPRVTVVPRFTSSISNTISAVIYDTSVSQVSVQTNRTLGNGDFDNFAAAFDYHAIGEWDGVS